MVCHLLPFAKVGQNSQPCLNQILWDWWNSLILDKNWLMRVKKTIENKEKGLGIDLRLRQLFNLNASSTWAKVTAYSI